MKKYRVEGEYVQWVSAVVEANTPEEAWVKASLLKDDEWQREGGTGGVDIKSIEETK